MLTRRRDAQRILRDHVRERHLRAAVRAQDLSGLLGSTERMSAEQWVDSCGLVRGVAPQALGLLHVLWCESAGTKIQTVIVETAAGEVEVAQDVVARPLDLREAAQRCGMSTAEAHRWLADACEVVTDNMLRRMPREGATL